MKKKKKRTGLKKGYLSLWRQGYFDQRELAIFLKVSLDFVKRNVLKEDRLGFPEPDRSKSRETKTWQWRAEEVIRRFGVRTKEYEDYRNVSPLMTVSEASGYLKVSISTVRRYYNHGRIPIIKLNRLVRFRVSDLDDFIRERTLEKRCKKE